jgi:hypothetical protein
VCAWSAAAAAHHNAAIAASTGQPLPPAVH